MDNEGFEPPTSSMLRRRSTPELIAHLFGNESNFLPFMPHCRGSCWACTSRATAQTMSRSSKTEPGELHDDELRAVDAALNDTRLARGVLSRFRSAALARLVICDLVSANLFVGVATALLLCVALCHMHSWYNCLSGKLLFFSLIAFVLGQSLLGWLVGWLVDWLPACYIFSFVRMTFIITIITCKYVAWIKIFLKRFFWGSLSFALLGHLRYLFLCFFLLFIYFKFRVPMNWPTFFHFPRVRLFAFFILIK